MANVHTTLVALFDDIADAIRGGSTITEQIKADAFPAYIRMLGYDGTIPATPSVLNSCSWDFIRWASDEGIADLLWNVGDAKNIIINGTIGIANFNSYSVCAFILGFNHNYEFESSGTVHFQIGRSGQSYGNNNICLTQSDDIGFDSRNGSFTMNPSTGSTSSSSNGGWSSCKMRTSVLGSNSSTMRPAINTFLNALPYDLRSNMKTISKYSDNVGGGTDNQNNVSSTTECLPLPSEFEIMGIQKYANSSEKNKQKQYEYYRNGNSKIKYRHDSTSVPFYNWTRSTCNKSNKEWCMITPSGSISYNYSGNRYGISPIFFV